MNGRVVLELPARAEYLLLARLAATGVGRSVGLSEETVADLKLAVTEAVANVVRHAYPDGADLGVTLELYALDGRVEAVVTDRGRGLDHVDVPLPDTEPGEGGMGLSIIRAIADEVELTVGPEGRGTRVRFACSRDH